MKLRTLSFVVLFIHILVSGCATTYSTPEDLRTNAKYKYSTTVNVDYQTAHKNILAKLRECNGENGSAVQIKSEIYSDLGESSIAWHLTGGFSSNYYFLLIDLKDIDKVSVKIESYAAHDGFKSTTDMFSEWSTGTSNKCK